MSVPFRIWAIAEGEQNPSWWITLDNGVTFTRADLDRKQQHCSELTLVGHGLNDVRISATFPAARKVGYQAARKFRDGT